MGDSSRLESGLPSAERDVIACLHHLGETTSRQIRDALRKVRPMSHPSVVTLLRRLEVKGLVAKRKGPVGKAFLFRATRHPQATLAGIVRHFVERVFQGNSVSLMASLLESRPPTANEVDQLQDLLDNLRRQKEKKGKASERGFQSPDP